MVDCRIRFALRALYRRLIDRLSVPLFAILLLGDGPKLERSGEARTSAPAIPMSTDEVALMGMLISELVSSDSSCEHRLAF